MYDVTGSPLLVVEIAMPYVNSSAIGRIEWSDGTLSIWFHDSGRYDYPGVPFALYERFLAARSKGTFYNDYIRDKYGV